MKSILEDLDDAQYYGSDHEERESKAANGAGAKETVEEELARLVRREREGTAKGKEEGGVRYGEGSSSSSSSSSSKKPALGTENNGKGQFLFRTVERWPARVALVFARAERAVKAPIASDVSARGVCIKKRRLTDQYRFVRVWS